jgi:hypothetical protein
MGSQAEGSSSDPFTANLNGQQQQAESDLGFFGFDGNGGDMWISTPFDSSIAPFGGGSNQVSLGLDVDSLNFLWSLPGLGTEEPGFE